MTSVVSSAEFAARRRDVREVVRRLTDGGPALVALSGGVDSSLVASLAYEALGPQAIAVTLVGPAVSEPERSRALRVAQSIGISHELVEADPLASDSYRENTANRCYFCRVTETAALLRLGAIRGVQQYLDGVHLDDLGADRPGLRAMQEAGFDHPLVWAGWRKSEVRRLAQLRQLPNWDQPSDACLASRVRHGMPITAELLRKIERAENHVLGRGFRRVRVRVDAQSARIEVDADEVTRLLEEPLATEVTAAVRSEGFTEVEIDRHGYPARPGA
ncbi:MAG: ATP-dependent sacrificial sulfur transferase LarE [Thermoplasmata archaeon]